MQRCGTLQPPSDPRENGTNAVAPKYACMAKGQRRMLFDERPGRARGRTKVGTGVKVEGNPGGQAAAAVPRAEAQRPGTLSRLSPEGGTEREEAWWRRRRKASKRDARNKEREKVREGDRERRRTCERMNETGGGSRIGRMARQTQAGTPPPPPQRRQRYTA